MSKNSSWHLLEQSSRSIARKRALLRMARVNCNSQVKIRKIRNKDRLLFLYTLCYNVTTSDKTDKITK